MILVAEQWGSVVALTIGYFVLLELVTKANAKRVGQEIQNAPNGSAAPVNSHRQENNQPMLSSQPGIRHRYAEYQSRSAEDPRHLRSLNPIGKYGSQWFHEGGIQS